MATYTAPARDTACVGLGIHALLLPSAPFARQHSSFYQILGKPPLPKEVRATTITKGQEQPPPPRSKSNHDDQRARRTTTKGKGNLKEQGQPPPPTGRAIFSDAINILDFPEEKRCLVFSNAHRTGQQLISPKRGRVRVRGRCCFG